MSIRLRALLVTLLCTLSLACGQKSDGEDGSGHPGDDPGLTPGNPSGDRARSELSHIFEGIENLDCNRDDCALSLTNPARRRVHFNAFKKPGCLPERISDFSIAAGEQPRARKMKAWFRCANSVDTFWATLELARDTSTEEAIRATASTRDTICSRHANRVVSYQPSTGLLFFECDYPPGDALRQKFEGWKSSLDRNGDSAMNTAEMRAFSFQNASTVRSLHAQWIEGDEYPSGYMEPATGMFMAYKAHVSPHIFFTEGAYRREYRNDQRNNSRCMTYSPYKGCFEVPLNDLAIRILFSFFGLELFRNEYSFSRL